MAVHRRGWLHSCAFDRIGNRAERRMRSASVGDTSRNTDDEGRRGKRNGNHRGKASRERETPSGQPYNGNHDRKGVAGRVELLKEQVKYEIGDERHSEDEQRARL